MYPSLLASDCIIMMCSDERQAQRQVNCLWHVPTVKRALKSAWHGKVGEPLSWAYMIGEGLYGFLARSLEMESSRKWQRGRRTTDSTTYAKC